MGTYNVHGGHNRIVPGAGHYLDEVTEDRRITAGLLHDMAERCMWDSTLIIGRNYINFTLYVTAIRSTEL